MDNLLIGELVWEMFGHLLAGTRIVMTPAEVVKRTPDFVNVLFQVRLLSYNIAAFILTSCITAQHKSLSPRSFVLEDFIGRNRIGQTCHR